MPSIVIYIYIFFKLTFNSNVHVHELIINSLGDVLYVFFFPTPHFKIKFKYHIVIMFVSKFLYILHRMIYPKKKYLI